VELIDMLVALGLAAALMLGVYSLSVYFAGATQQSELHAAVKLDAQELLKRTLLSPGDPPNWTDASEVRQLGLADPQLPGQLDPIKLAALAAADPENARDAQACVINTARGDYLVTGIDYGIYVWGTITTASVDPRVYERVLRGLFGDDWDKYDIELQIRPALEINVTLAGGRVEVRVSPPGTYNVEVCYMYWPSNGSGLQVAAVYAWKQGQGESKKWQIRIDARNAGPHAVRVDSLSTGSYTVSIGKVLDPYCSKSLKIELPEEGEPGSDALIQYTIIITSDESISASAAKSITMLKSHSELPQFPEKCETAGTVPSSACSTSKTGEEGSASVPVPGGAVFAYAYARGVMLKGVNYSRAGGGDVSLVGLVTKLDAGVYVVHAKLIQNVGPGASLCGCSDPGVSALGLRYLGLFLGGRTVPLLENVRVNPSQSLDLSDVCDSSGKERGGCLVPWRALGRAKFLIAAVERNSKGDPPKCGGIPQRDVIVMPLTGGLPPLSEVRFATWRRWVDRRPEALAASHARALADAGEITYVVDLWVYRYR
jgi:hypothetical protein